MRYRSQTHWSPEMSRTGLSGQSRVNRRPQETTPKVRRCRYNRGMSDEPRDDAPRKPTSMRPLKHFHWTALFAAVLAFVSLTRIGQAQTVETGLVKLADSTIEYFSRGEGEAIVLLPGGTLTVGCLDDLADPLAKAGYRVVGINFRGSGKSTGPSKGVSLQTMSDDVAGVIQALKLGPAHVAGNDFGNR